MPFGTESTFYIPNSSLAGSSLWGTDVRKVTVSDGGASDTTTQCQYGTGGTPVTRTVDPYTSQASDLDQTLYGWAIDPADMGSTADFIRSFPSGNHVANLRITQNGIAAADVTVFMYIYKVASAASSRTRTLLGSSSTTVSAGALSAETAVTVTVNPGAITFGPDETIQYSFEMQCIGTAITGRSGQFRTGTTTRMTTPELKTTAGMSGTSAGVATVDGTLAATASLAGSSSGLADALGVPTAVTGIIGTASAEATVAGVLGATGAMAGSTAGVADAPGVLGATAGLVGSSDGVASTSGALAGIAGLVGSANGTATALGEPSAVAGTVGTVSGQGTALGVAGKILGTIGTVDIGAGGGGGEVIIRPLLLVCED